MPWNPALYERYRAERERPGIELLAAVETDPREVWDLGCGTGALTRRISARWPKARVRGLDASGEMLAEARERGVEAIAGDIEEWRAEAPCDLLFSNAALHFVAGHETLFPRLLEQLAPGGVLAVQLPTSDDIPAARVVREVLERGGLGSPALRAAMIRRRVGPSAFYADLLEPRVRELRVWETTYLHLLEGEDPVYEWISATMLRPVLDELRGDERERFERECREGLRRVYPPRPSGRVAFPFPRLFLLAATEGG